MATSATATTSTAASTAAASTAATAPGTVQTSTASSGAATTTTPLFSTTQPTTGSHVVVHAKVTSTSSKLSDADIAVAVLAGLIALACLVWGVARMLAYEPRWTLSLRHSLAEAGFRASATWAELSDWARLGR
jgi:hypothetical protein